MEIDFEKLTIDKENEQVSYNDELHKYWTKDTKQSCISVTTLIHKFTTFDGEFWSAYKTLERVLSTDDFLQIKPELTKNKNIIQLNNFIKEYGVDIDEFNNTRNVILKEWDEKRETSCIRGTAIHKEHEMMHLAGKTQELQHLGLGGKFKSDSSNVLKPGVKGVYPELLVSRVSADGKLRVAGQIDLPIIDGYDVYICDYKTGKTIDKKSFYDRRTRKSAKMKYPLNNLDDTNFWHYTLQLSTYAWIIQKANPEFNIKKLILIHYDHDGGCTTHECEYLKDDVERMLGYYKKQIEHEEFNKTRQKITY